MAFSARRLGGVLLEGGSMTAYLLILATLLLMRQSDLVFAVAGFGVAAWGLLALRRSFLRGLLPGLLALLSLVLAVLALLDLVRWNENIFLESL